MTLALTLMFFELVILRHFSVHFEYVNDLHQF